MRKLLLVDDNTTVQRMVELAFEHEDITVSTVDSVPEAFEQIEADPPDVILAGEGYDVRSYVRSRPKLAHIPIVLLRGAFGSPEKIGAEADYDGVLAKPVHPKSMIDRVTRLLDQPRDARSRPSRRPRMEPVIKPPNSSQDPSSRIDPDLMLDKYFDQLDVAFRKAEGAARTSWEGAARTSWELADDGSALQWTPDAWVPSTAPDGWARPYSTKPIGNASVEHATPRDREGSRKASPAPAPPAASQSPLMISDEFVELLAQRLLERVNDRIVRSTVTEVVSRLARWLVVDEVERTKKGK